MAYILSVIILTLLLVILVSLGAFVIFARVRASRAGLDPRPLSSYNPFSRSSNSTSYPSPAPNSILDWVKEKYRSLTNRRTTSGGGYEEPLGRGTGGGGGGGRLGGRGRRGFGPLDPDEAWDARVGDEADAYGAGGGYYEEQELGLHPISTSTNNAHSGGYSGGGYGADAAVLPEYGTEDMGRGRSRSREPTAYVGGSQRGLDERYEEVTGTKGNRADPFGDEAERSDLRGVSPRPVVEGGKGHRIVGSTGSGGSGGEERKSMFHENM